MKKGGFRILASQNEAIERYIPKPIYYNNNLGFELRYEAAEEIRMGYNTPQF